jgi:hypothetical protein
MTPTFKPHKITPPTGRQIGYICDCGKKFPNQAQADNHMQEVAQELLQATEMTYELKRVEATNLKRTDPNPEYSMTQEELEDSHTKVTVKEAPVAETKEVSKTEETKALVPLQRVQTDVIRYAQKMMSKERAAEYATRVALIARENPKILAAINKNPDAFLASYMASATLDLMPNTPEQLAFIIPYGDKVQFQVGYRGLLQLARRSGEVMRINAELVFSGDDFDVQFGTERKIVHKPDFSVKPNRLLKGNSRLRHRQAD